MFPVKYRWPVFPLDGTPAGDYHRIIDEEGKVRSRTPNVSKFRDWPFEMNDDERKARYVEIIGKTGRSRANNMAAFFRATFDVWKDYKRSGKEKCLGRVQPDHRRRRRQDPERHAERPRAARRAEPLVGLRRYHAPAGAAPARDVHARLDVEPVLRAPLPRALPGPLPRRARRGRDARFRGHAHARAREDGRRPGRVVEDAYLERQRARHGLSVGHDPHADARSEQGRGRAAAARGARRDPAAHLAVPRDVRLQELPRRE